MHHDRFFLVCNIGLLKSESEIRGRLFAAPQTMEFSQPTFPFSRGSFQPRDQTQVSYSAGGFFTSWATREAQEYWSG